MGARRAGEARGCWRPLACMGWLVDVLLDSAASGWNTVEGEGISIEDGPGPLLPTADIPHHHSATKEQCCSHQPPVLTSTIAQNSWLVLPKRRSASTALR